MTKIFSQSVVTPEVKVCKCWLHRYY